MGKNKAFLNILLAAGMISVLTGVVFLIMLPAKQINYRIAFHFAVLIFGTAMIYVALIRRALFPFYLGLNICIFCLVGLVLFANVIPFSAKRYWPIAVISFGLTLLPTGYLKNRKFLTKYVIPSAMLVILGSFFLLFSLKIIKIPIIKFFMFLWPSVLMALGIILIAVYFYQQAFKDFSPENKDGDDD